MSASLLVVLGFAAVAQVYLTISLSAAYVETRFLRGVLRGRRADPERVASGAVQVTALISCGLSLGVAALLWGFLR